MHALRPVDRVEILILVDNYVDLLLPSSDCVRRPPLAENGEIPSETLVAEHGLSLLVTVHVNGESHSILLDSGYNSFSLEQNLRVLGESLDNVEFIVLSHGHMDHSGGLEWLLKTLSKPVKIILHPTSYARRYLDLPTGQRLKFPQTVRKDELERQGAELVEKVEPFLIANGTMLSTGQVPRVTDFEKGMPGALMDVDGELVNDPINDDQSIVVSLGDKGLVVISGCAHSGIVNSVLYARELAGQTRIHSVVGGFHLTGTAMEPSIDPTVAEMKKLRPEHVVPMHCTGPKAIRRFEAEFPNEFVLSSVGTRLVFSQ